MYVRVPKEMGLPPGTVGRLVRCCYGTRDAGSLWEDTYANVLVGMGLSRGKASPCCYYHSTKNIMPVVHGNDFVALGLAENLHWYEQRFKQHFEIGKLERLGTGPNDQREIRILHRIVRQTDQGVAYEADPRHIEL